MSARPGGGGGGGRARMGTNFGENIVDQGAVINGGPPMIEYDENAQVTITRPLDGREKTTRRNDHSVPAQPCATVCVR